MRRFIVLLPLVMLMSCGYRQQATEATKATEAQAPAVDVSDAPSPAAQLPEIPADVTSPSQKADYVMLHFWDNIDFSDPKTLADNLLVEQTFADFIEILPHTSSVDSATAAIDRFFERASASPESFNLMAATADKYLYTEDSPMRNRMLYQFFLQRILDGKSLNADQRDYYNRQMHELSNQQSTD